MKKITFLFSLLLTFLGVSSVHAAIGDVITNLSQLSNTKIYTISGKRGTLKQGETSLAGTGNSTADAADATQQFLIINKNGNYFLFAYGKDQFVNASQEAGAYGEPQAFAITTNTHDGTKATYPWRFTFDNKVLNFDNPGERVIIDTWTAQDGGNAFQFTEVGDLNDEAKAAAMEFACSKSNANQIVTQHDVDRPFVGTQTNWENVQNVLTILC